MPWFKVDDAFHEHAKVEALEADPVEHAVAIAAWTLVGTACARRLTDGIVTRSVLAKVLVSWPERQRFRAANALVRVGLWEPYEDGWRYHDWHDRNPSREDVVREREAAADRKRRSRGGGGSSGGGSHGGSHGGGHGVTPGVTPPVTAPVTSPGVTGDPGSTRAPARVRAPASRPDPTRPVEISAGGRVSDQVAPAREDPRDTLARAWRSGFVRRFERSGVGLTHSGPAGRDMAALIDAALTQPDPPAFVERALDGFFGTPRMASMRPAFAPRFLAEDPVGYAACSTTPSGSTDARNAELVAGIPRLEVL